MKVVLENSCGPVLISKRDKGTIPIGQRQCEAVRAVVLRRGEDCDGVEDEGLAVVAAVERRVASLAVALALVTALKDG